MSLAGSGFGLFLSPNARLIIGSAPKDRAASTGGLIATTRLLGQTLGATLAALLLAHGLASGRASPLIAAGLAAVAGGVQPGPAAAGHPEVVPGSRPRGVVARPSACRPKSRRRCPGPRRRSSGGWRGCG